MPHASFLNPSSSSPQPCAHGSGDKTTPHHPGQQHPTHISPQPRGDQGGRVTECLCGTPGQGCASGQAFLEMLADRAQLGETRDRESPTEGHL